MIFTAVTSAPALPNPVSPTPRSTVAVQRLADVPNTTVRYYDVAGRNVTAINRSIASQRPAPPGGRLAPASMDWTVKASFHQRTTDGQCQVTDANAVFSATADLPRLVEEDRLEKPLLERWRKYVAALEESEVPTLIFVYSLLDAVEQAMLSSSCEDAKAAGNLAIQKLRARAADFEQARRKAAASSGMFLDSARSNDPRDKRICKNLVGTGSRLNTLRICMAAREWEKLHESGQQATREMQDKPRLNKSF